MAEKRKSTASAPVKRKLRRIASPTPSPPPSSAPSPDVVPSALPSPPPPLRSPICPPSPPPSPTRPLEQPADGLSEDAAAAILANLPRSSSATPVDDQSFDPEENLVRLYVAAARLGYSLINVPGDGDCALHAVVHGLRPFGVDADVTSLRAALIETAGTDDHLVAAAISAFEAEHPGQGPALHEAWLASMARRGTFVDNTALAALATAIERPIIVFSPSSARVAVYAPSPAVPIVGAPVHVALNPELFRRDAQSNEIPTSSGHYFGAVAGGDLTVPTSITELAERMLPRLLSEHDQRVAEMPALIDSAESATVCAELEVNGKRLAQSVVMVG